MAFQLPTDIRHILTPLAEAVVPLGSWLARKQFAPALEQLIPPETGLPWRQPEATGLSTLSMEAIQFFVGLFDDDAGNEMLASRWAMLKGNPLAFFHPTQGSAEEWRKSRQLPAPDNGPLNPMPTFAPHEAGSSNFTYVVAGVNKTTDPVSRQRFYELCWQPLKEGFVEANPVDQATWFSFVNKLSKDQLANWPVTLPVASSAFIKRFTIDILLACLGQHNAALNAKDPLWQRAVLIEAGENRHVGNEYLPSQVGHAVATMLDQIPPSP